MSDGNFKYQISVKVGADMLNIRADTAEEFRTNIDALFGDGASIQVTSPYFAQAALKTAEPVTAPVAVAPQPVAQAPLTGEAPTDKQVAFARRLGIDPSGKTKKELSVLIEAKVN